MFSELSIGALVVVALIFVLVSRAALSLRYKIERNMRRNKFPDKRFVDWSSEIKQIKGVAARAGAALDADQNTIALEAFEATREQILTLLSKNEALLLFNIAPLLKASVNGTKKVVRDGKVADNWLQSHRFTMVFKLGKLEALAEVAFLNIQYLIRNQAALAKRQDDLQRKMAGLRVALFKGNAAVTQEAFDDLKKSLSALKKWADKLYENDDEGSNCIVLGRDDQWLDRIKALLKDVDTVVSSLGQGKRDDAYEAAVALYSALEAEEQVERHSALVTVARPIYLTNHVLDIILAQSDDLPEKLSDDQWLWFAENAGRLSGMADLLRFRSPRDVIFTSKVSDFGTCMSYGADMIVKACRAGKEDKLKSSLDHVRITRRNTMMSVKQEAEKDASLLQIDALQQLGL
ncbi:hypothetical protein [uncultured Cohaesibacter sp.]|uniref:hypothetical protein n=1 Tax=uncultured Cohaesibacter sp. TaxID=1002546 RepID=UPI0029C676CF|nr:hypothetical protein [uncultured Cohaesibacter sp.]